MCSLFGIIDYGGILKARDKNRILTVLSRKCEVRGTNATGIAYNYGKAIHVYKRPVAARKMRFHVPNGVSVVMGHTRMTTQGSAALNYNNHPWATRNFALAHNGVLWNDRYLRETESLPYTLIETDSYIAVQLLEKQKALNFQTIGAMAEKVQESFVFTILDRQNSLYFVRGDNPLAIFRYDGFYLYAPTVEVLRLTEQRLGLRHLDSIQAQEGDILKIDRKGNCCRDHFQPSNMWPRYFYGYEDEYGQISPYSGHYLTDAAKMIGVSPEIVQLLLDYGYDADAIEELLYNPRLLHDITSEIHCDWNGKGVTLWESVKL